LGAGLASAAALSAVNCYTRVLEVLLPDPVRPVLVRNEHGATIGQLDGTGITTRARDPRPLQIATARDFS